MAIGKITSKSLAADAVTSANLAPGAVTISDIPDSEITADKLHTTLDLSTKTLTLTQASVTAHESALSVTQSQISDLSTTSDLAEGTNLYYTDDKVKASTLTGGSLRGTINDATIQYATSYGGTPAQGSFFFDSLNQKLKVYTGSSFVDAVPSGSGGGGGGGESDATATFTKYTYSITSSTNSVSGADDASETLSYTTGGNQNVEVYVNGVKQVEGSTNDYVATTGTSVTFVDNLSSGDVVDIQVYELLTNDSFYLKTETYTQTESNTQISTALSGAISPSSAVINDIDISRITGATNYTQIKKTSTGSNLSITSQESIYLNMDANNDQAGRAVFIVSDTDVPGAGTVIAKFQEDGNVGIGTDTPSDELHINSTTTNVNLRLTRDTNTGARISGSDGNLTPSVIFETISGGTSTERMRINNLGNLLVGKTTTDSNAVGVELGSIGYGVFTRSSNKVAIFNRKSTDGTILDIQKDGVRVGHIGTTGGKLYIGSTDGSDAFLRFESNEISPCAHDGSFRDNVIDLGKSASRFDDIYATNGTIQTSDANEKQDIAELSDAEQRVAIACKSLLRKFRWRDAVETKGDDARIHFGIIAQDLQAAFAAEGLDAGCYSMFISSTWWEVTEDYIDNEGVAHTRIVTFETQDEAPEGATERTRLGVRYPELLAFIIGGI